jgi:hypothetical protein
MKVPLDGAVGERSRTILSFFSFISFFLIILFFKKEINSKNEEYGSNSVIQFQCFIFED